MNNPFISHEGWTPSHPWYYLSGGTRLNLKQIRAYAASQVDKYPFELMAEDTIAADKREEPRRSHDLKIIRSKVEKDLNRDISIYREVVRKLNYQRKHEPDKQPFTCCNDVHTSMSLKFAHLYNDFSQWDYVNKLLSKQADLFDLL